MKRRFHILLTITTALLMWSCNAFAQGKAPAPIDPAKIFSKVRTTLFQFNSANDVVKNINKIKTQNGIEDVAFNVESGIMTVTLKDKTKKTFYNPLLNGSIERDMDIKRYTPNPQKRIGKTVWIGNGLHNDAWFAERTKMLQDLAQRLCDVGFDVTYTPTWNDNSAFSSDIVLYHGHGYYIDGLHYINTGIPDKKIDNAELPSGMIISDPVGWKSKIKNFILDYDNMGHYYIINENYIKNKKSRMNLNSCVYLACCDLLDDKIDMANVFISKGATAVFAYEGFSTRTAVTGAAFLDQLSLGKTISEAYDYLETKFDNNWDAQKKYVDNDSEESDFKKTQEKGGDKRKGQYKNEYSRNIVYNDVVGREELTRLYNLLNGDSWDDAAKKNWLSDLPITAWAGVSVSKLSTTISVTINSGNLNLPADLTLENFKRIEKITLPKDSRVNNLTVQNCMILTHNPVIACNNLKIKDCPALYDIKLNGAKNVSIDDCEVLKALVISDALEVESLTVSNCKSLNSFECRSVSYSGKPESSLKSLSFKDCDILASVEIHGCPIYGTLDLSNCKGLKDVSISVTDIQQIKVGELESLSVRETPIKQTYESLPGVKKFYVQPKYIYTRLSKFKDEEKIPDAGEGFQYVGDLEDGHYYYKLNFDDGSGFYHILEPKDLKYWKTQTIW